MRTLRWRCTKVELVNFLCLISDQVGKLNISDVFSRFTNLLPSWKAASIKLTADLSIILYVEILLKIYYFVSDGVIV